MSSHQRSTEIDFNVNVRDEMLMFGSDEDGDDDDNDRRTNNLFTPENFTDFDDGVLRGGGGGGGFGGLDEIGLEFQKIISILHRYVLPLIILIGIVGNTVSFLVFVATPRLCRQSSSLYLAFLAMVDNVSLVTILVVWFGWIGVHIFHKNGWCQTVHYCTYVCSFLSAWTVVSFTCERWIVVFHPLKRHRLCTRRRALAVMTSLTVTSLVFYSFSLFTTNVHYLNGMQVCIEQTRYFVPLQVVRSIDTILIVIVPLIAIIVMNAMIGIKICHYTDRSTTTKGALQGGNDSSSPAAATDETVSSFSTLQKHATDVRIFRSHHFAKLPTLTMTTDKHQALTGGVDGTTPSFRPWRVLTRKQYTQVRITRALLIVSTVFVALNLPSYAFRIQAFVITIRQEAYDQFSLRAYIWQEFIQFLYYSNFSSRFFLYSACSLNFRCALYRLVCRLRRGPER